MHQIEQQLKVQIFQTEIQSLGLQEARQKLINQYNMSLEKTRLIASSWGIQDFDPETPVEEQLKSQIFASQVEELELPIVHCLLVELYVHNIAKDELRDYRWGNIESI